MGVVKALYAAGVLAVAASTTASAADLLPPPPPLSGPAAHVAPDYSGWYLRGDVGVGSSFSADTKSTFKQGLTPPEFKFHQSEVGDSAFIGLGFGYRFNSWLRFDVTGEYRGSQAYHAINSYGAPTCLDAGGNAATQCFDVYRGSVKGGVVMANAYVDLGTWAGLTPYVGVGLGGAMNRITGFYDFNPTNGGFGVGVDRTKYNFAWALMAGVSYAVTQNLSLELGYRYLDRGEALTRFRCGSPSCAGEVQHITMGSHDIRMGMRWMFANDVAIASPEPLVRKY